MMTKTIYSLAVALSLGASQALASCLEPSYFSGATLERQMERNFEYLICLHNGQRGTINELVMQQGTSASEVARGSQRSDEAFQELIQLYVSLGTENATLKAQVQRLEERLSAIENARSN